MVGAEFAGAGHERADVLGQAAAAEPETGVEESPADAGVVAQRVGQQGDVGVDCFAHLRDRVDERDLRRQERIRRHLDELGGLQVGQQEGHPLVEQWGGVEGADRLLGQHRIALHPKDNAIWVQGVLDGEPLAQELRIPGHLDGDALGGASRPARAHRSAAVPTGTVDLPTMTAGRRSRGGTNVSTTAYTWRRSAPYSPFFCGGVPTPRKCTSANSAASA